MRNKEKCTLYEKMQFINNNSDLKSLLFCLKTNGFHAIFNALLSALSIAAFTCLAGKFGTGVIGITKLIFNVLLTPAIVVVFLASVEYIILSVIVINNTYKILKNPNAYKASDINKRFRNVCIVGVIIYIFSGLCALFASHFICLKDIVEKPIIYYIVGCIMSLLFGIIWNIATYFRLQRINYGLLLKIDYETKPYKKFKIIRRQVIFEIMGCIFVLMSMIFYYYKMDFLVNESTYYTLFYVIYFTLLWMYIKQIYKWEFSKQSCNETIYPLNDIFRNN